MVVEKFLLCMWVIPHKMIWPPTVISNFVFFNHTPNFAIENATLKEHVAFNKFNSFVLVDISTFPGQQKIFWFYYPYQASFVWSHEPKQLWVGAGGIPPLKYFFKMEFRAYRVSFYNLSALEWSVSFFCWKELLGIRCSTFIAKSSRNLFQFHNFVCLDLNANRKIFKLLWSIAEIAALNFYWCRLILCVGVLQLCFRR